MPWTLLKCHESNPNQSVFLQAVIFNPATGELSSYPPLVIDAGTKPAIAPVPVVLPKRAVVAIFGGGNDDATTLVGPGARSCVNGADGNVFGQVFFCGGIHFFASVNAAHISIPPIGKGADGQLCPTVRSFKIVDQDQSDNVQTTYLVSPSGRIAQNTAQNRAALGTTTGNAQILVNGSDNTLLSDFVLPALDCSSWKVPDLSDNGNLVATQATNELQAAAYQQGPVAYIPLGDPMVGPGNLDMVNAYRASVDQPIALKPGMASTFAYCKHLMNRAPPFFANNKARFQAAPSLQAGVNLYDFLENRYSASLALLQCQQ